MDQEHPVELIPWSPEPSVRGTWSILSSCLGTLIICVWSAIHLDVTQGKSSTRVFLEKVGWLLVALLAPELLIMTATMQLVAAVRLCKDAQTLLGYPPKPPSWNKRKLCQIFGQETGYARSLNPVSDDPEQSTEKPSNSRRHPWTLTHSFYAVMGGFTLQDPHTIPVDRYLPSKQRSGTLTAHGIRLLMEYEPSLIPDIALVSIADRSKADGFAKAILVWQVLWFCLSCLNRLAEHLPLSLLEVSTIAHAVCAMITYALWWNKPKDVRDPIVITGDNASLLGAWMSVETSRTCSWENASLLGAWMSGDTSRGCDPDSGGNEDSATCRRMSACSMARSRYPGLNSANPNGVYYIRGNSNLSSSFAIIRSERISDIVGAVIRLLLLPSFLSTAAYGLPHLIGWNAVLSSHLELKFWRIASVAVVVAGATTEILGIFFFMYFILGDISILDVCYNGVSSILLCCICVSSLILYIVSSLYLTGESIRQLFALPPEAFLLPSWGNYWPHFS